MPVTLHCCKNNNIHNKVTRFMLPIGTNINMNGTALYQAAAAVFIALVHNIYLDFNLLFSIGSVAVLIYSSLLFFCFFVKQHLSGWRLNKWCKCKNLSPCAGSRQQRSAL